MKLFNHKKRRNRKNLRFITVMLAAVTVIVWLVLLFYKYVTSGISFSALLDDIIANILGILPPIIIFNFIYEYFSKDYVADEMSEQMLETLTGNTEMMGTFKEEVRINFIQSTVKSLVDDDKFDMVFGVLKPFISGRRYDMRLNFKYSIILDAFYRLCDMGNEVFSPEDYYLVKEHISFTKVLSVPEITLNKFSIGFFIEAVTLEKELVDKSYLFRESLKIRAAELQQLKAMTETEKKAFVVNCLQLQLLIGRAPAQISEVSVGDFGISIDLIPEPVVTETRFEVEIGFKMPQLKRRSEFLVSLPEPTLSPEIVFTYNQNISKITAYQFLNDDSKLIKEAAAIHGRITINPQGWIYPVKGVLFIIEDIDGDGAA